MASGKVVQMPRVGTLTPAQSYLALRAEPFVRSVRAAIEAWEAKHGDPPPVVYLNLETKAAIVRAGYRDEVAHALRVYLPPVPQGGGTHVYVLVTGRTGYVPWGSLERTKVVGSSEEVG